MSAIELTIPHITSGPPAQDIQVKYIQVDIVKVSVGFGLSNPEWLQTDNFYVFEQTINNTNTTFNNWTCCSGLANNNWASIARWQHDGNWYEYIDLSATFQQVWDYLESQRLTGWKIEDYYFLDCNEQYVTPEETFDVNESGVLFIHQDDNNRLRLIDPKVEKPTEGILKILPATKDGGQSRRELIASWSCSQQSRPGDPCGRNIYKYKWSFKVPCYLVAIAVDPTIWVGYPSSDEDKKKKQFNEDSKEDPQEDDENTDVHHSFGKTNGGGTSIKARRAVITGQKWSDTGEFDYLYVPSDIDLTQNNNGIIIGTGLNGGLAGPDYVDDNRFLANVKITRLKRSLTGPDILEFKEITKYDESGSFELNQRVYIALQDQVYFKGTIKSINRTLTKDEQSIEYTAIGMRNDLQKIPFAIQLKLTNYYLKDLFELVLNQVPSSIIADWDLSTCPDIVIPRIQTTQTTAGQFISQLLEYAGHFTYYIDNTGKFTLIDLKSGAQKTLQIPLEGTIRTPQNANNYLVISKRLDFDVSQCKTRALVYGDYYIKTLKVTRNAYFDRNKQAYRIPVETGNGQLMTSLPAGQSITIEVQNPETGKITTTSPVHIDVINNIIWFYYNTLASNGDYFSQLRVSVIYGIRYNPISADTGWQGTAYSQKGVQVFEFRFDPTYKKYDLYDGYSRDDTDKLLEYAHKLIEPYKDVRWGGQVILDGLNTDLNLGDRINFSGTTEDWSQLNMPILSIEWDFNEKTTTLEVTSNYWLYSGIIDPDLDFKEKLRRSKWQDSSFHYEIIRTPTHVVD